MRKAPHFDIICGCVINVALTLVLVPTTSNPFDFAALNGTAVSALSFHTPLFLNWKFGADYAFTNLAAACGGRVLAWVGFTLPAAMHISVKLLLVVGSLLAARSLLALGHLIGSPRSRTATILWLISPCAIWVAAGHAQIESVAIAATFIALLFVLEGRWLMAGLVTGIGVGFEYYPIAVGAAVLVLWMQRHASAKEVFRYGVGLAVALLVCFIPLLTNSVARLSLSGGLVGHATATQSQIDLKLGAVWSLFGLHGYLGALASHWYIVLVLTGAVSIALAVRRRDQGAAVAVVGVLLMAATILDPTTLPQFSVIALAGALLIGLTTPLPLALLAVPPVLTYIAYFFTTSLYVFFQDTDPSAFFETSGLLPWLPNSTAADDFFSTLALLAEITIIGTCCWHLRGRPAGAIRAGRQRRWYAADRRTAMLFPGFCSLVLLVFAIQPALWSGVVGKQPGQLYDTPYLITQRRALQFTVQPGHSESIIRAQFDPQLVAAVRNSKPTALGAIDFLPAVFYQQRNAGGPLLKPSISLLVHVRPLGSKAVTVSQVVVELLVHNHRWQTAGQMTPIHARSDEGRIDVLSSVFDVPTWALVTVAVPVRTSNSSVAHVRLRLTTPGCFLNSDLTNAAPWMIASYGSGTMTIAYAHHAQRVVYSFDLQTPGQAVVTVPKRALLDGNVRVVGLPVIARSVLNVAFAWSPVSLLAHVPTTPLQWLAGVVYLLLCLAALATIGLLPRRRSLRSSEAENYIGEQEPVLTEQEHDAMSNTPSD